MQVPIEHAAKWDRPDLPVLAGVALSATMGVGLWAMIIGVSWLILR